MRVPRLAIAMLAAIIAPQASSSVGAASSSFTLSSPTAQAGQPEVFTITRLSGGKGIYVLFKTADNSAHAGVDYTATSKLIYLKGGQLTATVSVPTFVNGNVVSASFRASIAASSVDVATVTAQINEPTRSCPDGSTIPYNSTCAPPLPPPNPSPIGPLTETALCSENSLWDTPQWQAYVAANPNNTLPAPPTVTAGVTYSVLYEPGGQQGGLVPNTYAGPFVVAVPVNDTNPENHGGYEFDPKCFPPAPTATAWISAPLQDGGFAVVRANDTLWDMTGPGAGRPLVPGEIVAVYFNGWGSQADGSTSFAVYALRDGTNGRALSSDLNGVAPANETPPPPLPADWWVPGQVNAAKNCADIHNASMGITQGSTYRAANVAGGHMKLAAGQSGDPASTWEVFAVDDQNAPNPAAAHVIVMGNCLTGS